jgi:radical SAM protein with 4Fe4S-binding SPASM domain
MDRLGEMVLKERSGPEQVVWELTLKCNLRCIHCGSSAGNPRSNELSTTEALQLCHDLSEILSEKVCFMGGEPFLRKEWDVLGKEVVDLGMKLLIISNGFLVNSNVISKLVHLQPYGFSLSLDGATAQTHDSIRGVPGSFGKVMESISLARDANLPTAVITTVNTMNFAELPLIKDFLLGKNIAWQIQVAAPQGRFPNQLTLSKDQFYSLGLFIASLKNQYSRKELPVIGAHCCGYYSTYIPEFGVSSHWSGCQAGISIVSVKSDGDVIGCLATPDTYIEGNIRKRSIIEIWNASDAFRYNRKFLRADLGTNCRECTYGEVCKGGCMGMSTALTGKPHNDPYCFHKIELDF